MKEFEGYQYKEKGICAPQGFRANGLNCGLNPVKEKNDLCLLVSDRECDTAAVYTQNKVKGAPILITKKHLFASNGKAQAVIANSKNANTCNHDGEEKAEQMCVLAAKALGIQTEKVLVASTGVIGQVLPIEPIEAAIPELVKGLSYDGNEKAVQAIMTTDTVPKQVAVEFVAEGKTVRIGGMAKGSGMIHPNMATTLNFITTDLAITSDLIQKALQEVVAVTYNCLSIDGDTSTNDMVCVMANGMAENKKITEENQAYQMFKQGLYIVMMNLTRMLAKDGEGATKLLECICSGAPDWNTAITVAKSVIVSPLFKCAMFGEDANWGRILCAVGNAKAEFAIDLVEVKLCSSAGELLVCQDGSGVAFSEEFAQTVLKEDEIQILIDLKQGEAAATAWGCDLTYDYVKINGDYRS
ncbi:MAG: bifunctional glutamate N-acetyltransferase/amino-acid acetyltransferase ArgJ [Lachnospiraceae bacterium]|nr:bifunctional glutamate N-acetyltransferase/amino-acid acetyltransferase ArgJ [Lachnospiraceae bacterium]